MEDRALLAAEWQTLQDNHEHYEKNSLLIKLGCLALCVAGLAGGITPPWLGFGVLLCWGQDAILKTWQARLGERLLRVEALLRQSPAPPGAMQLHSEWEAARPRGMALLIGYAASAARPTVAFPYLPILLAGGLAALPH